MRHRILLSLVTVGSLLFAALLTTTSPAYAASCTTSGNPPTFMDWDDPSGWNCAPGGAVVPAPTDTVTVANFRDILTSITRSASTTVSSVLEVISSAVLTNNAPFTMTNVLNLAGTFNNNSVFNNNAGSLNIFGGTFNNNNTLNSTYYINDASTLNNNGTINNHSELYVYASATLTNNGIIRSNDSLAEFFIASGGVVTNYGTINVVNSIGLSNYGTIINCGTIIGPITGTGIIKTAPCPPPTCFTDGRLNRCDAGQTVAVYCQKDGSLSIYAIFKSKGYFAFTATPAEIAKVPVHPAVNTLIKEKRGARLYRLTSGELQVNRAEDGTPSKEYHFIFGDCATPE